MKYRIKYFTSSSAADSILLKQNLSPLLKNLISFSPEVEKKEKSIMTRPNESWFNLRNLIRNMFTHHHFYTFNPLNAELNPICSLLVLLGAQHFLHVSRIRVKSLTLRLLMSYIYIYIYIYIWSTYS